MSISTSAFMPPYIRVSLNILQYLYLRPDSRIIAADLVETLLENKNMVLAVLGFLKDNEYVLGHAGHGGGYNIAPYMGDKTLAEVCDELGYRIGHSALPYDFASQIVEENIDRFLNSVTMHEVFTNNGKIEIQRKSGAV